MKKIKIFVAGSTQLKEERKELASLVSYMNSKYERHGVNIIFATHETLGNEQAEYNDFIKHRADIVIFLIKGVLGDKTARELELALNTKMKDYHPMVSIYLSAEVPMEEASNDQLDKILNQGETSYYYTKYKDNTELRALVNDRLQTFIHNYSKNQRTIFLHRLKRRLPYLGALSLLIIISAVVFVWGKNKEKNERIDAKNKEINELKKPRILVAGGGTVYNFIKQGYSVTGNYIDTLDIANPIHFPFIYYVHMPSTGAYALITEESITPSNYESKRYYPICISAGQAHETDFVNKIKREHFIATTGRIIELGIGKVSLTVLSYNPTGKSGKTSISLQELNKEIKRQTVYTTTVGSGTRNAYKEGYGVNLNPKTHVFSDAYTYKCEGENTDTTEVINCSTSNLFLANERYQPKLDNKISAKTDTMLVITENNDTAFMPLYIYFVAYTSGQDSLKYVIKKEIKDFLEQIDIDVPNDTISLSPNDDRLILPYKIFHR